MIFPRCAVTECNNPATVTFSINAWYGGIKLCEVCYEKYCKHQEAREKMIEERLKTERRGEDE